MNPKLLILIADVVWPPLTKVPGEAVLDKMEKSGVTEKVIVKGWIGEPPVAARLMV